MTALARTLRLASATVLLGCVTASCGGDPAAVEASIDRDTFVATYVDLRLSALGDASGEITDAERTRVLAKHGVTEDDLLSFADAYGADPATMKEVWNAVAEELRAAAGEDLPAETGDAR